MLGERVPVAAQDAGGGAGRVLAQDLEQGADPAQRQGRQVGVGAPQGEV